MNVEHLETNYDAELHYILDFLFAFGTVESKQAQREIAIQKFLDLDIAATYVLFSVVRHRLPQRAKYLFSGEDFAGKRQTILEVMQAIPYSA